MSLLLVVDTSVMQAAGDSTKAPDSRACRLCLEWTLEICHRVLVPPALSAEWKRHQGRRARRWQVEMCARGKRLSGLKEPVRLPLDLARFESKPREAVEKDLMLLEAAWQADKVIVTLDKNLRTALETTREGADLARRIRWIDPLTTSEDELRNLRPGS
jgi:hypothetical protein